MRLTSLSNKLVPAILRVSGENTMLIALLPIFGAMALVTQGPDAQQAVNSLVTGAAAMFTVGFIAALTGSLLES